MALELQYHYLVWYSLADAAIKGVKEDGLLGAFIGGIKGAAGGITAAIFFGYLMALIFNPKRKNKLRIYS